MKIAVVGVGGVGGYIGAKLIQSGADVTLIAPQKHCDVIEKNGLKVIEDESEFCVKANIKTSPSTSETFDLIFLCVKSYNIEGAIKNILHALTPESVIIPLSNGVEHRENILELVDAKVCDAAVYILSHLQERGVVRKQGKVFALTLSQEAENIKSTLEKAELRYKIVANSQEAIWKKYIFISAFATLTSYYDMSIKSVYDEHFTEAKRLLEEIADVAKALGINIESEVEKSLQTASKLPPKASTSMHLDRSKKRECEIETLSNYVIKMADKQGVEVPLIKKMYKELKERI